MEDETKRRADGLELYVEWFEKSGVSYTESSRDNLVIHFFGNTAIVSSQWTSQGDTGQFGWFSSTSSMTDPWVKQKGTWKCVATVPDKARQVFSEIQQVSFGPDTQYDVVVLFGLGDRRPINAGIMEQGQ